MYIQILILYFETSIAIVETDNIPLNHIIANWYNKHSLKTTLIFIKCYNFILIPVPHEFINFSVVFLFDFFFYKPFMQHNYTWDLNTKFTTKIKKITKFQHFLGELNMKPPLLYVQQIHNFIYNILFFRNCSWLKKKLTVKYELFAGNCQSRSKSVLRTLQGRWEKGDSFDVKRWVIHSLWPKNIEQWEICISVPHELSSVIMGSQNWEPTWVWNLSKAPPMESMQLMNGKHGMSSAQRAVPMITTNGAVSIQAVAFRHEKNDAK